MSPAAAAEPASTMSPMADDLEDELQKEDSVSAVRTVSSFAGGNGTNRVAAHKASSASDVSNLWTSSCSGLPFSPFSSQLKGRPAADEPHHGGAPSRGRRGVPGHPSYQYSIKVLKWTSSGIIGEVFRMPSFRNYVCLLIFL